MTIAGRHDDDPRNDVFACGDDTDARPPDLNAADPSSLEGFCAGIARGRQEHGVGAVGEDHSAVGLEQRKGPGRPRWVIAARPRRQSSNS